MPVTSLVCPHCEKPVDIQVAGVTRSRPCPNCGEMLMLQVAERGKKARRRALLMGGALPEVPSDRSINLPQAKVAETAAPASSSRITPPTTEPPVTARKPGLAAFDPPKESRASDSGRQSVPSREAPPESPPTESQRSPTTGSISRALILEPSHEPRVLEGDAFERMRLDPEVREFRRRLVIGASVVALIIAIVLVINWASGNDTPPPKKSPIAATPPAQLEPEVETEPPAVPAGNLVFKAPGSSDFQRSTAVTAPAAARDSTSMDVSLSVEVVRKFLAAPNWQDRRPWCRPVSDLEEKMKTFYSRHADGAILYDNIVESHEEVNGFLQHRVIFEGGARRAVNVQKTSSGPRVDWESFVGYSEMGWSDFMEQRPTSDVLMRVMVKDGYYYENQFGSPRILKCLELRAISEPGARPVHGYMERDGVIARRIEVWQRQSGAEEVPMVLRLKYPVDSRSDRQVWVSDAICQGWLIE